ncbi:ogr/delta-like zinc finger [Caudoviricetes sp.]|nr:ogr/delta-like zinc finger [Caudoviricetes sp.]
MKLCPDCRWPLEVTDVDDEGEPNEWQCVNIECRTDS